ncbi:hypothetical protein C8Q69DRAFT_494402 [Paecilomyces variotii]|uniref:Pre-mRNA-splicing factor 38B n=1 Tax=Byssochlamys spectabilis TaxID=264951 RepID=A0A443I4I2_BYSSP|nr:hypothetical protein C8Q69DRAFT_494402 [Paecilomyces variotii]KAJ9361830.1 hypothetical protein DTO280E4_3663 [Paecilomyces variotii]KAJ9408937.1 hypothetical protein DTO045G8_3506 [Paecilomyces variotii]RWQ98989.1 hypothetical protein C8Q69DRAFT_494402 [Paecilomyces variotii]
MPPLGEAIDDPTNSDDYVAQLLAKDARDSSLKYSALGMQAYMHRRPTTGAPKPNTRFLKNILRDTDSHNAALKRKEEEETRERMRNLRAEKSSSGRSRRHDEDRERAAKRRRVTDRDEEISSRRSRHYDDLAEEDRSRRHRRRRDSDDEDDHHRSSRRHRRRDDDDERHRSRRHRERSQSPSRSSRHIREHDRSSYHRRHRTRSSVSPSRSRSRSPESSRRKKYRSRDHEGRHSSRERHKVSSLSPRPGDKPETQRDKPEQATSTTQDRLSDDDSDPLEDIIGPLPPGSNKEPTIRTRGRGAYRTGTSNIDAHFASNYDPTLDVQLDDEEAGPTSRSTRRPVAGLMTEEDDWDMALEALRDRAVWKKKGAERLREAGFGDSMVERWAGNTAFSGLGDGEREKSIDDFKWAKKGEGREWDRGKVLTDDGDVDLKAPW